VASAGPAKSGPAEPPAGAAPTDSIYANPANLDAQDTEQDRSLRAFDAAWAAAVDQLENEQWSDALLTLSGFYNDPELTFEEHQRLIDLLDPLAGKVIYSTEHLLAEPYRARPGETIHDIAQQFQVPVTLLQNINGIADANAVPAGTTLKVVPGPFRAEVDLRRSELVLFLADHYAGRFSVSVGNDPAPQPAEYEVLDKQIGHEYVAPDGARIPPGAPDNPYGNWWIDLGKNTAVHGSPDTIPAHGGLGCLSLSTADASDVYGILTVGSKVLVR
jgi:LysM repeat protein